MIRRYGTLGPIILLGAVTAGGAAAQQPVQAAAECPAGVRPVGDLGYSGLSCNCTFYVSETHPEGSRWQFNSEPKIERVKRGGPADGKLMAGDVIVAIDGQLITTTDAGRRFAQVEPGKPVRLTVRRGGKELAVEITPGALCPEIEVLPPPAPTPPRVDAAPRAVREPRVVPVPPPAPDVAPTPLVPKIPVPDRLPRGWLGLSIQCSDCGISVSDSDAAPVWHFSSPPTVQSVEQESPAARAGVQAGDRITHVDGLAITTEEAGRRFGAVAPGDSITFRISRDGTTRDVTITPGERLRGAPRGPRPAPTPAPDMGVPLRPRPDEPRFSGVLGDAVIEVSGGPITVQRTEDEIVIRSADVTVRIRRSGS